MHVHYAHHRISSNRYDYVRPSNTWAFGVHVAHKRYPQGYDALLRFFDFPEDDPHHLRFEYAIYTTADYFLAHFLTRFF